jgi:hypothetical protein
MNTHTALRDRFAAAALPGVFAVAVELARTKSEDTLADPASIAMYAYEVADAMLDARRSRVSLAERFEGADSANELPAKSERRSA